MLRNTFRGGVHMYDGKELTASLPIQRLQPVGEAVYPLSQHIGKPAVPTVKKGDAVLVGQQIATPADGLSAGICASVSGTVKAIEKRLTVSGSRILSIVVDNDGQYTACERETPRDDFHDLDNGQIRAIARAAGIVGLGGAGFPTDTKLTPREDNAIAHIIINGAECEPYLTSDYRLMLEQTDALLGGVRILLKMFPSAKAIIGIEDNKPEAIRLLTHKTERHPDVSVGVLKTKYPQGGERSLIYALTGKKVHSRMLPYEAGCIVHNVATVIALYRAVAENTPLLTRIVTLSGDAYRNPGNYEVPIGISLQEVVELAGGFAAPPQQLIAGGPMMGTALMSADVPVQKTTSALLAFTENQTADLKTTNCIHCGRCVRVCPANLVPQLMVRAVRKGDMDAFKNLNGMECVSCGSCSYVCPAHIYLTQSFVQAKTAIATANKQTREAADK